MINGGPRAAHQASRELETFPGFLVFSCQCYFFIKNPIKTPLEKVAGFSSTPLSAWLSGWLARDTTILFFKLLRKRVLKFKPRGAELSPSPSGEQPPFPTLCSKAESPNICPGRGLSRQVYGEPQPRPLPAQRLQENAGKPRSVQGPKRGIPRATSTSLPAFPETCGPGPMVGCSAGAPAASRWGALGPLEGLLEQLPMLPESPSKQIPGKVKL